MLIKTLDEFQQYVRIVGIFPVETLIASVPDTQANYFPDVLGDELLNDLDAWYEIGDDKPDIPRYSALLPYVQRALARFTIFMASPELDVTITGSGIGVIMNQNIAPASADRVKKFDNANEERGWDNIETLLIFLEDHLSDYPEWVNSPAYTMDVRNLINSAIDFDFFYNIQRSRLKFKSLRPVMDNIEMLKIRKVISDELFDRILNEIKTGSITDPIKKILKKLQFSVANYTMADAMDGDKYQGHDQTVNENRFNRDLALFLSNGDKYLADVRTTIDTNPDDYPEYVNSPIYIGNTNYGFTNAKDNTIFVFGGSNASN
jgi:hypothetical protein